METQQQPLLKGVVRLGGSTEEIAQKLGPLADLVGTWKGNTGWNLIAVPSRSGPIEGFTVLIHSYSETITFTPITAPVPNRGGLTQQFVTGLTYELSITNNEDPYGVLHLENGMWLNMTDIEDQPNGRVVEGVLKTENTGPTIARLSSIPHGDVVLALGNAVTTKGQPAFPHVSAIPANEGLPPTVGYKDQYTRNPFINQFQAENVNKNLAELAAKQNILGVATITVDTQTDGGSIANIPFVEKFVKPSRFQSTFWIEDVKQGELVFKQLQYSQQSDLNFIKKQHKPGENGAPGDILWPHVNINTLRKVN